MQPVTLHHHIISKIRDDPGKEGFMGEIIQFRAEGDRRYALKEELKDCLMEEHMPGGQEEMYSVDLPQCRELSCFANRKGFCDALSDTDFGTRSCPFYKTVEDAVSDQLDALQRLVDMGRFDLIEKYRGTLEALGILDCEDSFFNEHSGDIDYLNRLRSLEKQMKEDSVLMTDEAGQEDSTENLAEILSDEWDEDDEEAGMTGGDQDERI